MKTIGLYLHIPFCAKKCAYCDFYSVTGAPAEYIEKYVDALINHCREYKTQLLGYKVDTIYVGGGTPSLLPNKQIIRLFKALKDSFDISRNCEVTIECNPGTLDEEKLKVLKKCGVNRLSIGVQSFDDSLLRVCGRIHSANDARNTVLLARKCGFSNISIDIIYGLPAQTLDSVYNSLKCAFELDVEHISFYGLKLEEGTSFYKLRNMLEFPSEDTECEMYFASRNLLIDNGYIHYEISNFCKKGMFSRHNVKYWNGDEYLGIGPGAHSYFAGKRFSFKRDVDLYIRSNTIGANETILDDYIDIPPSARTAEYVMLRFRLRDGIDTEMFYKRFGRDFDSIYYDRILPYINSGHIIKTPKGYAFSPEGMFVSNYILSRIIDFDVINPGI